jgi:hypothetical protein
MKRNSDQLQVTLIDPSLNFEKDSKKRRYFLTPFLTHRTADAATLMFKKDPSPNRVIHPDISHS